MDKNTLDVALEAGRSLVNKGIWPIKYVIVYARDEDLHTGEQFMFATSADDALRCTLVLLEQDMIITAVASTWA